MQQTPYSHIEEIESKQIVLKKTGNDRLKIKLSFTKEENPLPSVIHHGEIEKKMKSFELYYILGDVIGEGAHAVVKKGWTLPKNQDETPKLVAVKVFRTGDSEILNMKFLSHEAVVPAIELFINQKTAISYLVMEYCDYPTLMNLLDKKKRICENTIQFLSRALFGAIAHIHAKGICHRDIKPDNILIQLANPLPQSPAKLVDFGVSQRFLRIEPGKVGTQNQSMWTRTGNDNYNAPEIFMGSGYDATVDEWALGVVLYQCLTGFLPFNEYCLMDTIEAMNDQNHFQRKQFTSASLFLQDLIKQLLTVCPKKRIKAIDALQHPFFKHQGKMITKDDQYVQQPQQFRRINLTQSSHFIEQQQTTIINPSPLIKEEDEEDKDQGKFMDQVKYMDKLISFKDQNQLTTIHYIRKPDSNQQENINIDLISSYGAYQNKNMNSFFQFNLQSTKDYVLELTELDKIDNITSSIEYSKQENIKREMFGNIDIDLVQSSNFEYQKQKNTTAFGIQNSVDEQSQLENIKREMFSNIDIDLVQSSNFEYQKQKNNTTFEIQNSVDEQSQLENIKREMFIQSSNFEYQKQQNITTSEIQNSGDEQSQQENIKREIFNNIDIDLVSSSNSEYQKQKNITTSEIQNSGDEQTQQENIKKEIFNNIDIDLVSSSNFEYQKQKYFTNQEETTENILDLGDLMIPMFNEYILQ